ncbi:L-aminopeptidase DmpA. Serine peptidase. MEROPS family S58 [Pontibacter chinhatensis]|uniref:L-aminopeptidase DmpA. Serine peptidase. MEROPS family S58 n=2 Tax=Pontibacter chinhatensis TaxID=1436961 RepID=A0A1I2X137_9BACT|nr:P1 family peptidase [Pontibacter chinhatensis]SFH06747.1 L-aminopeptidase DmpA. Serine peptidase. MEROPS family S58 [Pontibacter chinhatensis]
MRLTFILILLMVMYTQAWGQERKRVREYGVKVGVLPTGKYNAITDVAGVTVGHMTLLEGENIRTGVTTILPHEGNVFQQKVPAAVHVGNGFGKLAGSTQIKELGNLESPIILTNTLGVGTAMNAVVGYILEQAGNEQVQSVNAVVGETNDGYLNDIRGRHVREEHVLQAIQQAKSGPVQEGNVGAGTGTVCFGWKGGIGTSSRKLPESAGAYTVGVLVQTNYGGVLQVNGVPVGKELDQYFMNQQIKDSADGSCMIIVATDAPVDARNLERMAMRAMMGLAKTGGIASNGSGDYVIAFSTNSEMRIPYTSGEKTQAAPILRNDEMSPLFMAAIEATEEAILNSMFMAEDMAGKEGRKVDALPLKKVLKLLKKYNAI